MYNYSKLQWLIKQKYKTLTEFAGYLGMTYPTLHNKLKGAYPFDQFEIEQICKLLKVSRKDIGEYFFTLAVENNSLRKE